MKSPSIAGLGLLAGASLVAAIGLPEYALAANTGPTVYAKAFSAAPHAGTQRDPWPGHAITRAINSLPPTGGTVSVADGIWLFDSDQFVSRGNFTLQGTSLNAQLIITTGFLAIGPYGDNGSPISNVTISTLTMDQSGADPNSSDQGVQLWACSDCELSDSVLYGHANNSVSVFFTQGGDTGRILRNKFTSRSAGGAQLQLNPLYNTRNSGFVVDSNEFDSVGLLLIGMNNTQVINNNMHNQSLGNFIGMFWAPSYQGTSNNLLFQNNTIDAAIGGNGGVLSGAPQDPGGGGTIRNVTIDHNTMRSFNGTIIAATVYDSEGSNTCLEMCSDESQTYNVRITNNNLDEQAGGSLIDVSGGISGSVHGAVVSGNTLHNDAGVKNIIGRDAHSYNVSIGSDNNCSGYQITGGRCPTLQVLRPPFP